MERIRVGIIMLMKCPECGHEVSSYADTCPHCGCNIQKAIKQKDAVEELAPYAQARIIRRFAASVMFAFFSVLSLILGICSACNVSEVLNKDVAPWMFGTFALFTIGSALCFLIAFIQYKSVKKVIDL